MPDLASPSLVAWLAGTFFVLIALAVYARQVRQIGRDGGKVFADQFDLPELLMSIVLAGTFTLLIFLNVRHREPEVQEMKIETVLPGSMFFVMFVVGISGFLLFRGIRLQHAFGLHRLTPQAALGWACGLVCAAFPLASVANAIVMLASRHQLEPQPLVDLFTKVARQRDYLAMGKILVAAVIIAPLCEEFMFRGFFYGTWKRYIGSWSAGFFACLLFAAFHASIAAFAGLFVLAACLNIAYERTGSLLVPIGMHALFNLTSLLFLYSQAQAGGVP